MKQLIIVTGLSGSGKSIALRAVSYTHLDVYKRQLIKQLVEQENPKKPYSDNQITDLLAKQGIVVARRTIAKYREALGIEPASLRKTL